MNSHAHTPGKQPSHGEEWNRLGEKARDMYTGARKGPEEVTPCSGGMEGRGRLGSWAEVGAQGRAAETRASLGVAGEFEEERGVKGEEAEEERLVRPALPLRL